MLYVCIKYSMCDLLWDVISRSVWSCDVDEINVYEKIMIENQKKKRENMKITEIFT